MGASASKAARAAGTTSPRRYPTRAPPTTTSNVSPQHHPPPAPNHQPGPTVHPQPQASSARNEAINLDASDPDFARSLRSIGPVQPNPTLSPSSAFPQPGNPNTPTLGRRGPDPRENPALAVLSSRARLQDEADKEFQLAGRRGHAGRQFLDAFTIRQILVQRDEHGKSAAEIERSMGLREGVVARLGVKGMVGLVQEQGRARREVDVV